MPFLLKSCPKCQGDMFIDKDDFGCQLECLQCSYSCELENWLKMQGWPEREKLVAAFASGDR